MPDPGCPAVSPGWSARLTCLWTVAHKNLDIRSQTIARLFNPYIARDRSIELKVKYEAIKRQDSGDWPVTGILLATGPRYPKVSCGARVRVTGRLQEPENLGDFDYMQYLARQDIYSQMSWPEVELISVGHGSIFYRANYALKGKAQTTIDSLLPDPQAALLSDILLGNDKGIPPDLADDFRRTGLTHIIAISGFRTMIRN